jgi:hypothetical protein
MYVPKNPFFSEFSYGYALTEELASSTEFGLKVLPIFPSQFAEGKLGFDVFIDRPGMPLFLRSQESSQRGGALSFGRLEGRTTGMCSWITGDG